MEDRIRELEAALSKLRDWLDPMHLREPNYQDCCDAHKFICFVLEKQPTP